jgi:transposase
VRASGNTLRLPARHGQNDRAIALTRKNALFAGSDGGARHWAMVASLVATAKLNGLEPQAWLTDVLERMVSGRTKAHELERFLPWVWKADQLGHT